MDRLSGWIAALACVLAATVSAVAVAQTARSGGNANAQLMQQMQQLASERTTLQAENEKLKSQLAAATKDRDALKAGQQTIERRAKDSSAALAHSNAQRDATEQELTQLKGKMQELIARFRETVGKLRDTEAESAANKRTLQVREHELSVCADHNGALYQLNDEALTRLEKQGFWSRAAQQEPFTKIARIRNENFADEYRARAKEQLLPPSAVPSSPAVPPGIPAPAPQSAPEAAPH
jgi:chromosome segregation ATPase